MFSKLALPTLCLLLAPSAFAGRGGHNTTWDPNLFPGRTITTINCNGSTDSAALASFVAAAVAANPAPQVLHLVGPKCNFESNNGFIWNGTLGGAGIQNVVVWAYGVTANAASMQTEGFYQDNIHSSRIATANIGDTTVTLVTSSENTRYAAGNWICVDGLELQTSGFPPNFQFFEYRLITAINAGTGVITLSAPLTKQYKSTWPLVSAGTGSTADLAGPASIHLMNPSWTTNSTIYGLTVPGPNGVNSSGRTISHYDVVFQGLGVAPSNSANINYFYSWLGSQVEIDKDVASLLFYRGGATQYLFFSASIDAVVFDGVTTPVLNGTGSNTTIRNSTIGTQTIVGPASFGHGTTVSIDGSTVVNGVNGAQSINTSLLTFSSGTFSLAKASGSVNQFYEWAVPGQKYFFAFYDGAIHRCTPDTIFSITDVTQDATNNNAVTDLGATLPTPTCAGQPPNRYFAYPAATIIQKFSGPADLTQFSAP